MHLTKKGEDQQLVFALFNDPVAGIYFMMLFSAVNGRNNVTCPRA